MHATLGGGGICASVPLTPTASAISLSVSFNLCIITPTTTTSASTRTRNNRAVAIMAWLALVMALTLEFSKSCDERVATCLCECWGQWGGDRGRCLARQFHERGRLVAVRGGAIQFHLFEGVAAAGWHAAVHCTDTCVTLSASKGVAYLT